MFLEVCWISCLLRRCRCCLTPLHQVCIDGTATLEGSGCRIDAILTLRIVPSNDHRFDTTLHTLLDFI